MQGKKVGWRPIEEGLGKGEIPTRLVQTVVKRFKARDRRLERRRIVNNRQSVTVLFRDAIWTQDGTHLGRIFGDKVEAQVIKDRGTLRNVALSVGDAADGEDVVMLLEAAKRENGGLPLVWQTDNDPPYKSEPVESYLERERVVHLLSRVYTPVDNGAAEIGMRELKGECGLGKGVKLCSVHEAAKLIGKSAVLLNEGRLRGSKGYLSANDLAERIPSWYNAADRNRFYQEACEAKNRAVQGKKNRAAQLAERQAVLMVMQKDGMLTIKRGGKPLNTQKVETFL
jgi:transposase InsO family protein